MRGLPLWALMTAGLAAAAVALDSDKANAAAVTVYSNDFSAPAGPEWSNQKTEESPTGKRLLGRFVQGDSPVSLNLTNLVSHSGLTVEFDFYAIGSMDGNTAPDLISFAADGTTLRTTTFSNTNEPQAYPDDYPDGDHEPQTGEIDEDSLGFPYSNGDSTYRLRFAIPHTASSFSFAVVTTGIDTELDDESWGLDNISVVAEATSALSQPPAPTTNPAGFERCAKKARRTHRKALLKAKKKLTKAKGKSKRRARKQLQHSKKRAAKKRKAQLKRCRARFL